MSRTYGSVSLSADQTQWIIGRAEPHVSIRLKQLFPSIPKAAVPPYRLPHNLVTDTDLDWFMQRYPLDISEMDHASLESGRQSFLRRQAEMERILMPDYAPDGGAQLREGQSLRPYQWQAIEVLRRRGRLLLGDEGGLGKTYTAAGFMVAEPAALPAAVVCDAHMQRQWKEKIEAFTHLRVHLIKKGSPYDLPPADVYVYRISQVAGWSNIFETGFFKSVTYDEPQSLRTGASTAKGAACKVLSANTNYHLGLTATPIYNYGDEMWHIMQFIDDAALGQWPEFEREWCIAVGNGKYRIKDPKALGTYLREQYVMLRRLKSDVGQQLPKVSRIVEHIDYDEKAVAAVEDLARALAIKATTASFVERGSAARELDIMMRQTTGVAKARTVAAFARLMIEAGEPVVLWGWHREVYEIWNKELADLNPAMYTGSESASQKEAAKSRFLSGETDLLIMSLRSGAGVDGLQHRCCTGIFGELDWSPGIHQQCLDAQTEVLTQRGFLGPDDLQRDDLVAAYDPATATVMWLPVKNRVDRPLADGEQMFECLGPSLDIRVTGGHRMLASKEAPWRTGRRPFEFVQADELSEWKTAYKIPVAGFQDVPREAILTDDEIRLIGWYITDGCLNLRSQQLIVCQSETSPHLQDLERCLAGANMHFTISRTKAGTGSQFNRRSDLLRYAIPKTGLKRDVNWRGWLRLEPYLDKELSPLLESLSRRQLGILLEAMHMGDGAKSLSKSYSISIGRRKLAERLQSLCVRRGYRANLFPRILPSGKAHYNLGIKDMQHKHVGPKASRRKMSLRPSPAVLGERVWCVENDLGTLFIRRNGKVAVVGNCIWRLDREGQQNPVTAFFLVTDDGSDPPIMDVLGIKASEAQNIVDPYLGVEIKENDTSHLRKLVERYLDRKRGAA